LKSMLVMSFCANTDAAKRNTAAMQATDLITFISQVISLFGSCSILGELCVQPHLVGLLPQADVEYLDHNGERHGKVNIALWNVIFEAFDDERKADHQEERKSEHLDRRVTLDEVADRSGKEHHRDDRDDDRGDHHPDVVDHTDRRDNRIERKDDVEQHYLD